MYTLQNLTQSETKQILKFQQIVDDLLDTDIFREGIPEISSHREFNSSTGEFEETWTEPSEKDLKEALYNIRLLHAHKEPTKLEKVCDVLIARIAEPSLSCRIELVKRKYIEYLERAPGGIIVVFRDNPMAEAIEQSPRKALDLYFNSKYFHRDERKAKELFDMSVIAHDLRMMFWFGIITIVSKSAEVRAILLNELEIPSTP